MKLIIISAVSVDGIIGIGEKIPWKISEDFKHFRETTMDNMLMVGLNTYQTLPPMALEGREFIIMNRDEPFDVIKKSVKTFQFRELDTVMELLHNGKNDFEQVFVIGGASIYNLLIDYCDDAIITWVNKTYPEGDKKFPIDNLFANFDEYSDQDWQKSKSGLSYKITYYKRSNGSPKKENP